MNMYLYGYGPEGAERFILVDMGVSFPTMESTPGVDLIMADPAWIQARADRLEAIFITHGHEDHVGALGLLWHRLQAPVYARRFTAALAKGKMERAGQPTDAVRQVDAWPHVVQAGPFTRRLPADRALDPGELGAGHRHAGGADPAHAATSRPTRRRWSASPSTREALRALGDEGVKVLACDSTNVFNAHAGRSEATLIEPIGALMQAAEGMVVATTFASNVARLQTLAAGGAGGRAAGRGARAGDEHDAEDRACGRGARRLSRRPSTRSTPTTCRGASLLVLATGSQGERRAATAQLAQGRYMGLRARAPATPSSSRRRPSPATRSRSRAS